MIVEFRKSARGFRPAKYREILAPGVVSMAKRKLLLAGADADLPDLHAALLQPLGERLRQTEH